MKKTILYSNRTALDNNPYLSLYFMSEEGKGVYEIEWAWGNTWLSCFFKLCRTLARRRKLRYVFGVRKIQKGYTR